MNSQLSIIVVVDVDAALEQQTLTGNTYLIDNNRINGSSGQGTDKLVTVVKGSQIMNWLVYPADIYNGKYVYLSDVRGEAVDKGVMVPQVFESPELTSRGLWWGANVTSNQNKIFSYDLVLNVNGQEMTFTSNVYVKRAFSNYDPSEGVLEDRSPKFKDMKSIRFFKPLGG